MNELTTKIEALLFASGRSITKKKLGELVGVSVEDVEAALDAVAGHLNIEGSGVRLFVSEKEVSLVTDPSVSEEIRDYLRKDVTGELTQPSVETLAIIAYRGPVTKPEIEQIRGVNCSVILRNLMIRGLIDEKVQKRGETTYTVSMRFMQHMGLEEVSGLPDYDKLSAHELLEALVNQGEA